MEQRLLKKFIITKKIGAGAFGEIFQAIDISSKDEVAIKMEQAKTTHPQLLYEARVYQYLHQDEKAWEKGIPKIYYGSNEGPNNIMVMELLGSSLEDLFAICGRKFTLKTTLQLGDQMLARVEYLHSRRFIHRDMKPDNFAMGRGKNQKKVYMIDFGLAKKFMNRDEVHIPYRDGKSLTGTARYASINTHQGIEQSRRDDIESLGYILVYFLLGSLPWQNMRATNKKEKYEKIMEKKIVTPLETLTKHCPPCFSQLISYARNLGFQDKPNYEYIKGLIKTGFTLAGITNDNVYDWTIVKAPEKRSPVNASPAQDPNPQIATPTPPKVPEENQNNQTTNATLPGSGIKSDLNTNVEQDKVELAPKG